MCVFILTATLLTVTVPLTSVINTEFWSEW
jgi:hypothetical protein